MQAKWDEMFGKKKEEVLEDVKVKKPHKKAVAKKVERKMKKTATKKKTAMSNTTDNVSMKKPKNVEKKKRTS